MLRNSDVRCIFLLLGLSLLLWIPRLRGPIDIRFDGGVYYILGTSLADGKGYRLLNEPGEIEAIQYPPLLPFIVAMHQWMLGTADFLVVGSWLRIFSLIVSGGLAVAAYAFARPHLPPCLALLAGAICVLALHTYYLSDLLYTEIPFALLTTLFAIVNRRNERTSCLVLAALLAVAACLMRTAGIALLVAWVAESLLQSRFKQAAVRVAVGLIPVLLWQTYIWRVASSQEYRQPTYAYQRATYYYSNVSYVENTRLISPFTPELGQATNGQMIKRIVTNLVILPWTLGEAVSAPTGFWKWPLRRINTWIGSEVLPLWLVMIPLILLGCVVIGCLVTGGVLLVARQEWFVPLFLTASLGLICLTPWPEQFLRYLAPLMPFLALLLVRALTYFGAEYKVRCTGRRTKAGVVFGIIVLTIVFCLQSLTLAGTYAGGLNEVHYYDASGNAAVHRLFFYDPPWQELDIAWEWLRHRAVPSDVIATSLPHAAYVRTGLKAVMPPLEADRDQARRLLDSVPVKYVVLDELPHPGISQRYAAPAVEERPDVWKQIYCVPGGKTRIYERQP
jgi:hypothetical protein